MITIADTDLVVHPLCLGSNIFGSNANEAESHAVMDAYFNHGGNFIDTADMYNQWVEGHIGGESETIIGSWMKARNNRQSMVIATKVSKMDTRPGLSARNIFAACEESLNRLQTDYIDLYYSHEDDASVSLEETLGAYAQLIAQGKVRYIAASNFTPARLRESIKFSNDNNLPAYVAVQELYNLVDRTTYEGEMQQVVAELGVKLHVHTNKAGVAEGANPFTTGISEYTRIMKTSALRQALDECEFDAAIGGSRRDEEKSRAKERIFSVRDAGHVWDPRNQRPE